MKITLSVSAIVAFAVAPVLAAEHVSIDLTGVRIRNATNQFRSSSPNTIDPSYGYTYDISGLVRGESGLLLILYPTPTDLAAILESLQPGASALLSGEVYNASNAHPIGIAGQRVDGTTVINGVTVTFGMTISAGIGADDVASFSLTDVVLTPSLIVGSLIFTSGNVGISRMHVTAGDMNFDGTVNQFDIQGFVDALIDPALYVANYGHDPRFGGDVNRDGTLNAFDIDPFIDVLTP